MKSYSPSPALAVAMVATQLLGPAALWAAEQRGVRVDANRQIIVSALRGNQLTAETKVLQFREAVAEGARVTTGAGTTAELLIGNRVVVTLSNGTTALVRAVSADQTTIQVTKGMVRVAAAASALGPQGVVTVQTPSGQIQTRGGIVRVLVETLAPKTGQIPIGDARAYRMANAPGPMAAAESERGEIIQVEEGVVEIVGTKGKAVTAGVGQSVTLQDGEAGNIAGLVTQGSVRPRVMATAEHTQTPKEGRDYLVALQVDQATKLGKALTGRAETGEGESEKKSDTKNTINGATGGVSLQNNLVSALFGSGSATNPASGSALIDRTGAGFGGNNNNGGFGISSACEDLSSCNASVKGNGRNALLVFTRKDPVEGFVIKTTPPLQEFDPDGGDLGKMKVFAEKDSCDGSCLASHTAANRMSNVGFRSLKDTPSIASNFTATKELILIGGNPNDGHGGIPPDEQLIVRGVDRGVDEVELGNRSIYPTDRHPSALETFDPTPGPIVAANSTVVVKTSSDFAPPSSEFDEGVFVGGTLGQFSNLSIPSPKGIALVNDGSGGISHIDGAITATTAKDRPPIVLSGGVVLDQGTTATIGKTEATDRYFNSGDTPLLDKLDNPKNAPLLRFQGALLSVIDGPNNKGQDKVITSLTMRDRMLGVYDGSVIKTNGGSKALLSVLDAKLDATQLKRPTESIPLIDIADGKHFTLGNEVAEDGTRTVTESPGSPPNVTVTSAMVTRSTIPLDGALLEASAPLVALTKANMTTTSHFADLAGNKTQSLLLNDALVALNNASILRISGSLLNLNAATATVNGYLFSLNNGSTLALSNGTLPNGVLTHGTLFSLNDGSSLTLNGSAFGVFGAGANTLSIDNNLCGSGAACGMLVNSANQLIVQRDGTPFHVAGVSHNVVLPNNFNVFDIAPGAPVPDISIGKDDALFKVDGTSSLTIRGAKVH